MELYGDFFWLYSLCVAVGSIFFFAALLIVLRSDGSRSKRILGLTLLVWALVLFTPPTVAGSNVKLIEGGIIHYKLLFVVGNAMALPERASLCSKNGVEGIWNERNVAAMEEPGDQDVEILEHANGIVKKDILRQSAKNGIVEKRPDERTEE